LCVVGGVIDCVWCRVQSSKVVLGGTEPAQVKAIGRALSRLPVPAVWSLSEGDAPDQAAIDALGLAPHVKVRLQHMRPP
jgi:hypothetical protein